MTESETYESKPQPATLLAAMAKHGITVTAEFVPWSQSRNKGEKSPSLNWYVAVWNRDVVILRTDYSAGMAHCPGYTLPADHRDKVCRWECESGFAGRYSPNDYVLRRVRAGHMRVQPKPADVMHSLILDAEALDHSTYESWAADFGYDEDSRKGEAIYRQCLELALKLRAGLGESVLADLRDAAQDY